MEATAQEDTFWSWTDLLLFMGVGLPALVVVFWLVHLLMKAFTDNKALLVMVPQFAGQAAMLVPLALLFRWKYERSLWKAIRLRVPARYIGPSLWLGLAVAIGVLLTAVAMRTPQMQNPMQDMMDDPASAPWVALFAVSIGPVVEEILFRGLLQQSAARSLGPVAGILVGAVPFAILHGPQYGWSWRHVLMIAAAGSAFGWWRMRTGSTGASSLMHAVYNGVFVAGFLVGRTAL
jgi:membrane protease YdiL (CAAX protease family)